MLIVRCSIKFLCGLSKQVIEHPVSMTSLIVLTNINVKVEVEM